MGCLKIRALYFWINPMAKAHLLGYPRVGAKRELKFALESFWRKESSSEDLQKTAKTLRANHWQKQQDAGLSFITSNDFSMYDHVLDHTVLFGAEPKRFAKLPFGEKVISPENAHFVISIAGCSKLPRASAK